MSAPHQAKSCVLVAVMCFYIATACATARNDTLGEAYVAPAQLNLRRELSGKTGNTATLHHGESVHIIDVRRRFVKIRSATGVEGWVDTSQLLSPEQMEALRRASAEALQLPSHGAATVYEALNVHIEPNRQSPALARIAEGTYVDVIGHTVTSKTAVLASPPLVVQRPQPPRRRKERQTRALHLPPPPPPPKAPTNWQQLSTERIPGTAEATKETTGHTGPGSKKGEPDKKPAVLEDWSRVRLRNKQSGWVLSRNLVMAIPDEVAQYAEGRRITSYFDLAVVNDEEKGAKHDWLWTTSSGPHPYDFDSWRVFLWNRRRHRYETSYRQSGVEGYFPVVVDPADSSTFGRTFHLITRDEDGVMRRRTYVFDTVRVHLTNTENYKARTPEDSGQMTRAVQRPAAQQRGNLVSRWWSRMREKFGSKKAANE